MFLYYYYLLFVSHNIYLDYIDTRYSIPGIITSFGDSISKQNMAKKIQQSRKRKKKTEKIKMKWKTKQNFLTLYNNCKRQYYYCVLLLLLSIIMLMTITYCIVGM